MKVWPKSGRHPAGFTLIELLLVIAVIGIMSALIVAAVSNATRDANLTIGRQQQAVLQEALHAWIAASSSGAGSLSTARATYSSNTAKLTLLADYLDGGTYEHFTNNTSDAAKIRSDALARAGVYLQFSAWSSSNQPRVDMVQE